jgi:antitoxin ParD1/3/4
MRSSKPITVTLGDLQTGVDERVKSGAYNSASEVVRAGLRALQREEAALNEIMRTDSRLGFASAAPHSQNSLNVELCAMTLDRGFAFSD